MNTKNRNNYFRAISLFVLAIALFIMVTPGCRKNYTPKPKSYFRIDFPEKRYRVYDSAQCPYRFDIPEYARVIPFKGAMAEPWWINIQFPGFKGTVYMSYKTLNHNLGSHVEDIRTLAYKHIVKADDIVEHSFSFPDRQVYGIIYDIKGNTASSLSFFATDSTTHFLTGALYFNVLPNKDSLAPVIRFFTADIEHLIETLQWN